MPKVFNPATFNAYFLREVKRGCCSVRRLQQQHIRTNGCALLLVQACAKLPIILKHREKPGRILRIPGGQSASWKKVLSEKEVLAGHPPPGMGVQVGGGFGQWMHPKVQIQRGRNSSAKSEVKTTQKKNPETRVLPPVQKCLVQFLLVQTSFTSCPSFISTRPQSATRPGDTGWEKRGSWLAPPG
eukprot:EG_transcript_10140